MKTFNIHPDNTNKQSNTLAGNKDVFIKKNSVPSEASLADVLLKNKSSPIISYHTGTKVSFSMENDLHIVVTTVTESNSNTVIRQIPSEETIDRLRLLNRYYNRPMVNTVNYKT